MSPSVIKRLLGLLGCANDYALMIFLFLVVSLEQLVLLYDTFKKIFAGLFHFKETNHRFAQKLTEIRKHFFA